MHNSDAILKHAVELAVQQINRDKVPPQEAVTKVARDLTLTPQFIKRAAEAINVALTYNHMKQAKDRGADFPIVDASKVVRDIFSGSEKTAAEFQAERFSSNQEEELTPKYARYLSDPRYQAAYAQIAGSLSASSFPMSVNGIYEKTANLVRDLKQEDDNQRTKLAGADFAVGESFCAILHALSKAADYRSSFARFENDVYTQHGQAAVPFLDLLHGTLKTGEERGEHDDNRTVADPCPEARLFTQFLAKTAALTTATTEAGLAATALADCQREVRDIFSQVKSAAPVDELTALQKLPTLRRKRVLPGDEELDPVLKRANQRLAEEADAEEARIKHAFSFVDSAMDQLKEKGTPGPSLATNSDADNLQRKFILQELATTDPILKHVEPQRLVDGYSQMLSVAPELAREKELVRSTLRSMSASQALGPFEGQQLMQANNEMLKQRALAQGRPAPGGKA